MTMKSNTTFKALSASIDLLRDDVFTGRVDRRTAIIRQAVIRSKIHQATVIGFLTLTQAGELDVFAIRAIEPDIPT